MARKSKTKRGGFWPFTSDPSKPSVLQTVRTSVSNTLSAAKNAVVGTTDVAKTAADQTGIPSTLTNTTTAGRRLKTAGGDTMLGGRRRSKKSRKSSRRTRRR